MFTELIRKGKWSYMFLAFVATLAVAALATLANSRSEADTKSSINSNNEQVQTGRYTNYNETTTRFIN